MPAKRVSVSVRRVVASRAERRCEYCRSPTAFATQSFTVEHIVPRKSGGASTLDNLAWACFGCNAYKHARTDGLDVESGRIAALFNPRRQQWNDHFKWTDDFLWIAGITASGRVTVAMLRLNRQELIDLRRALLLTGWHPPLVG